MTTNNSAQERLQEAAAFYQTLPEDQKFEGISDYFQERFQLADPLVVKESILRIRIHVAVPGTWEYEAARIEKEMLRRCEEHDDIPICVSISEWTENLTEEAIEYFSEEYKMEFKIGTKVRGILGSYDEYTIVRYGIVCANEAAYIVDRDPFDESTMHDYRKYRPKQENFETAQEYFDAVQEYDRNEVARQARILATAKMVRVVWVDCDGNKVSEGLTQANKLREFTVADAEADAKLPLVSKYLTPRKAVAPSATPSTEAVTV